MIPYWWQWLWYGCSSDHRLLLIKGQFQPGSLSWSFLLPGPLVLLHVLTKPLRIIPKIRLPASCLSICASIHPYIHPVSKLICVLASLFIIHGHPVCLLPPPTQAVYFRQFESDWAGWQLLWPLSMCVINCLVIFTVPSCIRWKCLGHYNLGEFPIFHK